MTSSLRFALLLALAGCGSNGTPATPDLMAAAPADLATSGTGGGGGSAATISVTAPVSMTGTPRQLIVAAFDSLPVAGPPAAILYQGNSPAIAAGQTLTVMGDAGALSGDKYVLAVLYMNGGGMLAPKPGVDYASAGTKVTFTGHALSIGPLTLARVPGGDM